MPQRPTFGLPPRNAQFRKIFKPEIRSARTGASRQAPSRINADRKRKCNQNGRSYAASRERPVLSASRNRRPRQSGRDMLKPVPVESTPTTVLHRTNPYPVASDIPASLPAGHGAGILCRGFAPIAIRRRSICPHAMTHQASSSPLAARLSVLLLLRIYVDRRQRRWGLPFRY